MSLSKPSLLFDLGNVLLPIDLNKTYQAFADLSSKYSAEEVKELTHSQSLWAAYESGLQSDNEFRDYLRESLDLSCTDGQFDQAFSSLLLDFHPGVYAWLENLSHQYPLFLLSNTSAIHAQHFTQVPLGPKGENLFSLFQKVYFSFDLGMIKPDENIYHHVLQDLSLKPENLVFFDDNFHNIESAKRVGIDGVLINPSCSLKQIDSYLLQLCS
ncbi:HAD family hydrolase [Aquirufa aurantiipilula]|uniref:HAD family hydrolase n=1 Tax=Aquirufa aurantiipilula TaxID=2696561 RepID=UPI001CAA6DD8|nr:HAD family phosphatase [Aquirufa aurantiipilula]MBZ1325392.1 HAD family phosphatase [Aquirufa aurantiipilula]